MDGNTPLAPGEDILFLALTRPALWRGVPYEGAILNWMGTTIIFIMMKDPAWLLLGVGIHYVLRELAARDYNMFGILRLWLDTKGQALNLGYWGASSVSPLPFGPARHPREVRLYV